MKKLLLFSALVFLSTLIGCSYNYDSRLTLIDASIADDPAQAITALNNINHDSFSTANRHYYDLLTIKANDKDYRKHTSDSLVLDVIDWFADHDKSRYAEALYYGGRVYADLGDRPTALRFFQDVLDELPDDRNTELRRNIVSN